MSYGVAKFPATTEERVNGMSDVLNGQRVLVVGGGGDGIGRAITRALAVAGATVAVADIDPVRARGAAEEIAASGTTTLALSGDAHRTPDADRLVRETVEGLGGLDVLVTVIGGQTGFAPYAKVADTTDEAWDVVVDLNLTAVFRLTRAAIRVFLEQGTGGSIVAIGSVASLTSAYELAPYSAAKAGLNNLAGNVSIEYGEQNIRMNIVSPGPVLTAQAASVLTADRAAPLPARRFGTPEEIAHAAVFAASPFASYLNGQNIVVDGAATRHQIAFALR